jgi:dihydrofolate reductase
MNAVSWMNTRLVKENVAREVRELRAGTGPDISIFGSGTIIQLLAREGLIDEYLIVVSPVILGKGKPLFKDFERTGLRHIEAINFNSGNVLLHYASSNL